MNASRALPVFSVAFVVLYLVAMYDNLALMTYFPRIRQWLPLAAVLPNTAGPGMYWYGWIATSAIGAAACAALSLLVPVNLLAPAARRASWIAPIVVMLTLVYILRSWFLH
jgi:hypothetical protein